MSKEIKGCGVVDIDNVTIVVDDATNVISVKDGVVSLPTATTSVLGGVKQASVVAVPASFATLAEARTYINTLVTALVTSGAIVISA